MRLAISNQHKTALFRTVLCWLWTHIALKNPHLIPSVKRFVVINKKNSKRFIMESDRDGRDKKINFMSLPMRLGYRERSVPQPYRRAYCTSFGVRNPN